jgi:hypothetical protein
VHIASNKHPSNAATTNAAPTHQIAADYACAALLLRLPGYVPMPAFQVGGRVGCGLLFAQGRLVGSVCCVSNP